ncbi:MAG: hypothetical protein BWY46_00639 [Firmicutes bacterium ADurb.Bin300]|nr:MAG: hypothetical protein BWY46_00639 [Firmicutes bacterium ADurb.Bin300]
MLSVVAQAAYTQKWMIYYKKGVCNPDFTESLGVRKNTHSNLFNISSTNQTGWTTPKGCIIKHNDYLVISAEYPLPNGTPVTNKPLAQILVGTAHNVMIRGSDWQVGTDTMDIQYDVDVS